MYDKDKIIDLYTNLDEKCKDKVISIPFYKEKISYDSIKYYEENNLESHLTKQFSIKRIKNELLKKGHKTLYSHAGSGKTKLLTVKLPVVAINERMRILYLCNRKIILDQLKRTDEYFGNYVDFKTYQWLEEIVEKKIKKDIEIKGLSKYDITQFSFNKEEFPYDVVVADECHYFVSDPTFNQRVDFSYFALKNNTHSSIIWTTATPERFEKMRKFEQFKLDVDSIKNNFIDENSKKNIEIVGSIPSNLKTKYIEEEKEDSKVFVFNNNKKENKEMMEHFNKNMIKTGIVHSKSENSISITEELEIALRNGTLSDFDVSIATNSHMNGANIIVDGNTLKIMIFDEFNIENLIQMLNRARIDENTEIKIVIPNGQKINRNQNQLLQELSFECQLIKNETGDIVGFTEYKDDSVKISNRKSKQRIPHYMQYDSVLDKGDDNIILRRSLLGFYVTFEKYLENKNVLSAGKGKIATFLKEYIQRELLRYMPMSNIKIETQSKKDLLKYEPISDIFETMLLGSDSGEYFIYGDDLKELKKDIKERIGFNSISKVNERLYEEGGMYEVKSITKKINKKAKQVWKISY